MTPDQAIELLAPAVPRADAPATWVDLGAGEGTFTRALARMLGRAGHVYAVERDATAVRALEELASDSAKADGSAHIHVVRGDFTRDDTVPPADGILLANSLHYVSADAQSWLLAHLAGKLRPAGRVVLIEYDRQVPNPWVPYPVARRRLDRLAADAGLGKADVVSTAPSRFGPELYCAVMAVAG